MAPGLELREIVEGLNSGRYAPEKIALLRHTPQDTHSAIELALPPILNDQPQDIVDGRGFADALNADYWISSVAGTQVVLPNGSPAHTTVIHGIYYADGHRGAELIAGRTPGRRYYTYRLCPVREDHGLHKLIGRVFAWGPSPRRWTERLTKDHSFVELN
jgi:hypothetical protein